MVIVGTSVVDIPYYNFGLPVHPTYVQFLNAHSVLLEMPLTSTNVRRHVRCSNVFAQSAAQNCTTAAKVVA